MHFCKLLSAWGLEWDRVGADGAVEVGARSVCPVFGTALAVTQWVVKHVMHLSAFVLLVCLSGRDNHAEVVLASALLCETVVSPSRPSVPSSPSLSLLHDWSFCHYFLAAGGDPGNLVNLLTTNCLLLPCCLDKHPGWGGVKPLWPIKVVLEEEAATATAWIPPVLTFYMFTGTFELWIFICCGLKDQWLIFSFSLSHPVLS